MSITPPLRFLSTISQVSAMLPARTNRLWSSSHTMCESFSNALPPMSPCETGRSSRLRLCSRLNWLRFTSTSCCRIATSRSVWLTISTRSWISRTLSTVTSCR